MGYGSRVYGWSDHGLCDVLQLAVPYDAAGAGWNLSDIQTYSSFYGVPRP